MQPSSKTPLLVIGAGPYGLSTAAFARESGIETVVVGRPMGFWREHMPEGMFLRSGAEWHLDASGIHTLEAFLEERGIAKRDVDPIPLETFLDYCDWFRQEKGISVREELVVDLAKSEGRFEVTLVGGDSITADAVVCAPGMQHYAQLPDWASSVPPDRAAHSCDFVRFEELRGSRVLIVGGRQSAYEWAALIREHGAERVDVVHRHDVPRFEQVSWKFIDVHVERTTRVLGYWRNLRTRDRDAINRRFWEVGRLTLEAWLAPRLDRPCIHLWPGTDVVEAVASGLGSQLDVRLSNSERLAIDQIVFATGYRVDLTQVPYLTGLVEGLELADGFPVLDEWLGTNLSGLYITGFSASQDFGPFFGFVRASPAAATLIVRDVLSRA